MLTLEQIPSHNHGGTTTGTGAHSHTTDGPAAKDDGGSTDKHFALGDGPPQEPGERRDWPGISVRGGDHTHTIPSAGGGKGHGHPLPDIPTEPPYQVVQYLIRVK